MRTYKDIAKLRILTDVQGIKGWVIEMEMRDKSSPTGKRFATFSVDYGDDFLKSVAESIQKQLETGDAWNSKL